MSDSIVAVVSKQVQRASTSDWLSEFAIAEGKNQQTLHILDRVCQLPTQSNNKKIQYGRFPQLAQQITKALQDKLICTWGTNHHVEHILMGMFDNEHIPRPTYRKPVLDVKLLLQDAFSVRDLSLKTASIHYGIDSYDVNCLASNAAVLRGVLDAYMLGACKDVGGVIKCLKQAGKAIDSIGYFIFIGGVPYCTRGMFDSVKMRAIPSGYFRHLAEQDTFPDDLREICRLASNGIYPTRKY